MLSLQVHVEQPVSWGAQACLKNPEVEVVQHVAMDAVLADVGLIAITPAWKPLLIVAVAPAHLDVHLVARVIVLAGVLVHVLHTTAKAK